MRKMLVWSAAVMTNHPEKAQLEKMIQEGEKKP
jgi:hypothetical protein